jgi:teichuronic acid exporter
MSVAPTTGVPSPGGATGAVRPAAPPADAPKKSYGKTAKQGAMWSVIRQGGHELLAIPSSMIMARLLSPTDFGITVAASFFVQLASRLTQFGFGAAIVRIKELRPEHASSVFFVNLVTGMLSYMVLYVSAPSIGAWLRSPEAGALLPVAALTFLITPFGAVPSALISRRMQFRYLAAADWTDITIGVVVTVMLAWNGWGYWSIVYGHVISVFARVCLQLYLSAWRPTLRFSRQALRELLSFGLGIQTKHLIEYASFNIDNLIVGRILGMASLGLYDKAFSTMNRLVNRLHLGQAPFRIFAIIHEDVDRFRRAYSRLILGVTVLAYPAFAAAITVAEPLFTVLYGEQWLAAVLPFQLLCVGGMLKLLNAYGSHANEVAGRIWSQVGRQATGAVLIVAGAVLGSTYGGVSGAAFGVALAMVLLTVSMQALVRRATGLSWKAMMAPQVPGLACAAALVGVLLLTEQGVRAVVPNPAALVLLLTQVAVGGVFYAICVLFSPFAAVRHIVRETIDDLVPGPGGRLLNRLSVRAWGA